MAITAERVVTELVADTAGHDAKIRTSARVVEQSMTQVERSATRAEAAVRASNNNTARSFDMAGQRSRLLGFQIADVGAQLAGGTSPFLIIAQQAPQMANALEGGTSALSRMAGFLSGPWGAALLAGGSLLAIMASRLIGTRTELEKATSELERNAQKTRIAEQAQAMFGRTLEGVTQRIREQRQELDAANQSQAQGQQQALNAAMANHAQLEALRTQNLRTQARISPQVRESWARAQAELRAGRDPGGWVIQAQRLQQQLDRLMAENNRINAELSESAYNIRQAQVSIATRQAEVAADPVSRINDQYDRMADSAREAARWNDELARSLQGTLTGIEAQRRAALQAERDRERQARQEGTMTQFVRPVPGQVTSGYGHRARPTAGASTFHQGVDFRAPVGTNVVAPAGGVVIRTGTRAGLGNVVWIDHGSGTISELNHLLNATVQVGQTVRQGEVVALSGNSGTSTGPHLDWRVRVGAGQNGSGGRFVDPVGGRMRFRADMGSATANAGNRRPTDDITDEQRRAAYEMAAYLEEMFRDIEILPMAEQELADLISNTLPTLEEALAGVAEAAPDLGEMLTTEDQQRIEQFAANFRQDLASGIADAIVNGRSLGDTLVNSFKRAAAALIESGIMQLLTGSGFNGKGGAGGLFNFIGSAIGSVFGAPAIPKFASGGAFSIGGRGGIDQNILSINGQPIAKVSRGETGLIMPQGAALSGASGRAAMGGGGMGGRLDVYVHGNEDFYAKVDARATGISVAVYDQREPGTIRSAAAKTMSAAGRPRLNRG